MKPVSDIVACVCDHGLFLPVAHRLAKDCKRVLYWMPHAEGFSTIRKGIIGDGFSDIEWCDDPWKAKSDIDLFVFPDIEFSGMQLELVRQGYPVWGSGVGDIIELSREIFLRLLANNGLDVPEYRAFNGLDDLRIMLLKSEDKFIKISRWRGDMETFHWRSWSLDSGILDYLAHRFGPVQNEQRFLVFDPIKTNIELGGDSYCIDGQWPSIMLNGTEWKDKGYFGIVTKREHMPEQLRRVFDVFGPVLAGYGYRCQFSCEVRVQGDKSYFIDPTCRGGLPSTASQIMLWRNYSDIIWAGANGELIDPVPAAKFSAECVLKAKAPKDGWVVAEFPDELMEHVHIAKAAFIDGRFCIPPEEGEHTEIGWLCAIGDSPTETIQKLGDLASLLPENVIAEYRSMLDIVDEIEEAKGEGLPMTPEKMPEPEKVVESP